MLTVIFTGLFLWIAATIVVSTVHSIKQLLHKPYVIVLYCVDPTYSIVPFSLLGSVGHPARVCEIADPCFISYWSWWRHQMETFSALLALCAGNSRVPGEFPAQKPVMRSFDVFIDLRLNKRLSKQSRGWWFKTLSYPLWRHCTDCITIDLLSGHWACVYVLAYVGWISLVFAKYHTIGAIRHLRRVHSFHWLTNSWFANARGEYHKV